MNKYFRFYCFLLGLSPLLFSGADWLQFRGTRSNAVARGEAQIPLQWSASKNLAWKAELPGRGVSSPIVVQGRVVVTCSDGVDQDRMLVVCLDGDSGEEQWRRQFWATGRTASHPISANAAPTPASDGRRIFAFFSSNDLICLSLDGDLLWYRGLAHDYPKAGNDAGMGSSPLVVGETVVVQIENQGDSFAAGLNTATGETRWRINRPRTASWSSPVALPGKETRPAAALLQSPSGLTAVDAKTGKKLWTFDQPCAAISSGIAKHDRVYVASRGLTALQIDANVEPRKLWDQNRLGPGNASPLLHQGRLYSLKPGGVLTCGDSQTGDALWQLRLKGSFWASPVAAGDHLILVNQDGLAQVVGLAKKGKGKIVQTNKLGESVMATPAIVEDALYIRSEKHLWKFSAK